MKNKNLTTNPDKTTTTPHHHPTTGQQQNIAMAHVQNQSSKTTQPTTPTQPPKTRKPSQRHRQGTQTNSIDINTLLSSQTSHAHRARPLGSAAEAISHASGLNSPGANRRTLSAPPRHSSPARIRAERLTARARPAGKCGGGHPGPAARSEGSCCPPLPGDSENSRRPASRVQIPSLCPGSHARSRRSGSYLGTTRTPANRFFPRRRTSHSPPIRSSAAGTRSGSSTRTLLR